jgi:hypothetical protein
MDIKSAINAVNQHGALLVFPIKNSKEPLSLWSHFFPRSEMVWEWNEDSDHRVADLWHLREKLSSSGKVVYSKWFRGRATLFAKDLLPSLLVLMNLPETGDDRFEAGLSSGALEMCKLLDDNSPLSTKQLKELSGLQGKFLEADYQRRLNELWRRFLIVGTGEIDDGAFPSLAMGSTRHFFEEEWREALDRTTDEALRHVIDRLGAKSAFTRYLLKLRPAVSELMLSRKKHIAVN